MSLLLSYFCLALAMAIVGAYVGFSKALVIFSRARLGLNPSVNAVATIIIAVVAVGVVLASFVIARNERRRALDAAVARRPATA